MYISFASGLIANSGQQKRLVEYLTLMLLPCGLTSLYLALTIHRYIYIYIQILSASLLVGVS